MIHPWALKAALEWLHIDITSIYLPLFSPHSSINFFFFVTNFLSLIPRKYCMKNLLQLSVNLEQRGAACYSFKSEAVLKPSFVMVFVPPFLHNLAVVLSVHMPLSWR